MWVTSREEKRIGKYAFEAGASQGYLVRFWDCADGVTDLGGKPDPQFDGSADPNAILDIIRDRKGERVLWVLRDLPPWLDAKAGGVLTLRKLRSLAQALPEKARDDAQSILVISSGVDVPSDLLEVATVLEWSLPDREEIAKLVDAAVASLPESKRKDALGGRRDAVVDAAVGLSSEEAQGTFARSLVKVPGSPVIDPAVIAAEKKRAIGQGGLLEYIDPPSFGMEGVGGLDNWKQWLKESELAFSPEARAYGLKPRRGALVIGIPGCGKTMSAKALSAEWQVPLVKLDLGAMRSKFVGESEANLRQGLAKIDALGRVVVVIDEIEKALAGSSSEGDSGVAADALGTLLSWMQDRESDAFIIATANDVSKLPPELMRKGRFDEVWWVDLPNIEERAAIIVSSLKQHGRDASDLGIDLIELAEATDKFSGAELAELVPSAMFSAFADGGREVTTADLMTAAKAVVPMNKTSGKKLDALRVEWKNRARLATTPLTTAAAGSGRQLEV
jgi:MoxR-like ATPase